LIWTKAGCSLVLQVTDEFLPAVKPALLLTLLLSVSAAFAASPNDGAGWPMLHGDLQRSGFYPALPKGPFKLVWRKELWSELTGPRAEVIGDTKLVFMGTYAGKMFAWEARTGAEKWVFKTRGAIGHSPALSEGRLFFGSLDRNLYALDASRGEKIWNYECKAGIWTSPVVFRGLVLFGARDGVFYALDASDGRLVWHFQTGDRILNSAAICEERRRVIFASEDMHVYCLNVSDGALLWKSRKLQGLSVRDYFPVIARGLVFITTNPVKDFHTILTQHEQMLVNRAGFAGADKRYIPGTREDVEREQAMIVEFLRKNPAEQTFYAFNVSDGKEPWIAPVLYTGGLHNPPAPPCANPLTGEVFTQLRSAYGMWDGGGEVRSFTCFGRLDLKTGRVELIDHGYKSKQPGRPAGAKDMPWMTFNYIGDETQTLSCTPTALVCTHQGFVGALDLKSGLTERLYGKRDTYGGFYGPGNFGWESQGGYDRAKTARQPFGLVNEWHGPARAMVSVIGGKIYFPVGSQVLCLEGR
jgi:outer membrane protein assembly factor BamB